MRELARRSSWGAALLCLAFSSIVSARLSDMRAPRGTRASGDVSGDLLVEISRRPSFALGFRNFFGDLVWLEAVQVSGSRKMTREEYDRLFVLLNAVADYDPRFEIPYLLGGLILGESPRHTREALMILERGRTRNPTDWRFPFYLGYTRYFVLEEPAEGGKAMAEAARLPGSPAYLPTLAARMLAEGREPATALALLAAMEGQETDAARKAILRRRIREVIVERDIHALEGAVSAFRHRTGRLPEDAGELVRAGLIPDLPREPNGGRYLLLPDGTVRSDRTGERLKVLKSR